MKKAKRKAKARPARVRVKSRGVGKGPAVPAIKCGHCGYAITKGGKFGPTASNELRRAFGAPPVRKPAQRGRRGRQ